MYTFFCVYIYLHVYMYISVATQGSLQFPSGSSLRHGQLRYHQPPATAAITALYPGLESIPEHQVFQGYSLGCFVL